ncbi:holin [Kitasatospora sp. NPDC096204]|uniref:holin n=1 Tax=Kitasatospora sp. NPDC096204 TaxID=3364094 RepID=UPI0037FA5E03
MRKFILDLVERTVTTYAAAFLGLLLADKFDLTSMGALKAAAVAALPAALSVVKGAVATRVGDPASAALLARPRE